MLLRIELVTSSKPRVWQLLLREALRALGHEAWLRGVPDARHLKELRALAGFEALAYRSVSGGGQSALADAIALPDVLPCDVSIDLVGDKSGRPANGARRLIVLADGASGEAALLAPLLNGRSPELVVALMRGNELQPLSRGVPALEERHQIIRSLDRVCARLVDLVVLALRRVEGAAPMTAFSARSPIRLGPTEVAAAATRIFAGRLEARLGARGKAGVEWRVAWRHATQDSLIQETFAWPQARYDVLPDDGQRYYADPFLFAHEGRCWMFCEEFPFATGRGLISAVEMGPHGPIGIPRPVLEDTCHLSYPQVFAHQGEIYMIPETSGRSTIELWRAQRMPDRWTLQSVLIEGVNAADATLVRHADRWWIFAAIADRGQSSWDTLGIFFSDRLDGPWQAHSANPVLVDARAARPAGRMFTRNDELWRPVQDCSGGYGGALGFARVTELTAEGFAQDSGPSLAPPGSWQARGVHTVDAAAGFEVIDVLMAPTTQPLAS